MKNLYRIFMLILLFPVPLLHSQSLSPSVISSSGGFYANSEGMLSFTTGEMAAVETYSNGTSFLTQGFQQPWDLGTYITEHPFQDFSIGVYPNPSNGQFYLLTNSDLDLQMTAVISDLLGQKIGQVQFDQLSKINIQTFDIDEVPSGTYLLSLRISDRNTSQENLFNTKITIVK